MDSSLPIKELRVRQLMGYTLLDQSLPSLLGKGNTIVVHTVNPHSWVCASRDTNFRHALLNGDLLVADGVGLLLASLILQRAPIHRTTGSDMWLSLMQELQRTAGRCFYLGSTPEVLSKLEHQVHKSFPGVTAGSYSPPFCAEFSNEHIEEMIKVVNAFKPDVLFLGITAPRQEKLAEQLRGRVNPQVMVAIGAVFDFVAGSQPRAPKIMRQMGLEWLYRLIREPRRMWRRNFISMPIFIFSVFNYWFKGRR